MTYLLGKMMVFLLAAGIFGMLIGWLFKRFFAVKRNNTQLSLFEAERKLHQQDMAQLETNWQEKYSTLNKERHKTKGLLSTQEQENLRLLNSIKTNQQALNALEVDFTTLKSEQLAAQDLQHQQLSSAQRQNAVLANKYAFMKTAALPDDLQKISGIGEANEQVLQENGITCYAQLAAFSAEDEKRCGDKLGTFSSRVSREAWVKQAKILHKEKYGEDV
jgi:predicted flap endonuclease-1-like 5' DNA nuclease